MQYKRKGDSYPSSMAAAKGETATLLRNCIKRFLACQFRKNLSDFIEQPLGCSIEIIS